MIASNVPPRLRHLLPLAEIWGIGDDFEREELVERAPIDELREMVQTVDAADAEGLYDWLTGTDSHADPPSAEYVAITCLTMAADSGRLRLRQQAP